MGKELGVHGMRTPSTTPDPSTGQRKPARQDILDTPFCASRGALTAPYHAASIAHRDERGRRERGDKTAESQEDSMDDVWIEKLAIHELCARYCLTIDAQDSDGWAACFTDDGVFEFDGQAIRG